MIRIALILGLVLGFAGPGFAVNYLEGVGISRDGDSVVVSVTTTSSCDYNVFLTEEKPERIVIDLVGVTNELAEKQFMSLPTQSISSIRTSQYKAEPDPQARIVLDINRPIGFSEYTSGNDVIVKLPVAADEVAFTKWISPGSAPVYRPAVEKESETVEVPAPSSPESEVVAAAVPTSSESETVESTASASQESAVVENKATLSSESETVETTTSMSRESAAVESEASSSSEQNEETIVVESLPVPVSRPIQSMGIQVDTTPKRQIIEYAALSSKDPFKPLVGAGAGKVSDGLPSLENLKLVGILEDSRMNRALLEDAEGNGYMLKPNDRIQSGFLVSVTERKAIFQVTEYGWTRTVALELEIPEIRLR